MKKLLIAAVLMSAAAGSMAQTVDINLGNSGYYGQLDLLNLGKPPVIYQKPMWIDQTVPNQGQPVYMRVPPGHAKKWDKHCARYNACGQRVLFVQDSWYNNTYVPQYAKIKGNGNNGNSGKAMSHKGNHSQSSDVRSNDMGKADKHDKHDKADKGHGNGKGGGKGNGKGKD